ncbi:MAG: hypothetical protein V2I54_07210 [Bacteroidales bacterium]|jgi:long-subunit fatty acid transport protein|nr:hypothetical protein [Bacteroidales bacterium]
MIKKTLLALGIILITLLQIKGQSITNSPYTRFGIGEIDRSGFNQNKAMGGISAGLRSNNHINFLNPASISSQDSLSFIFDVGISGVSKNLKSDDNSLTFNNFAFDHLAISFPIKKWWYMSAGVTPYSKIGYNINKTDAYDLIDTVDMKYNYYGNGGITQLFFTNSFNIYQGLSVGFNINYLFGSTEQYNQAYLDLEDSYSTVIINKIKMNKVTYDLGVQYKGEINDKYFYVAGFSYSNKINFNATNDQSILMTENFNLYDVNVIDYLANYRSNYDTITSSKNTNYKVEIPERLSIGLTAGINDKLTLGIDYSYQDWSNIQSLNVNDNFATDQTIRLGVEYIPDHRSLRNYLNKINYRAGFYHNSSYLKLNGEQIKNYGITFGLGFPIANQKTSLNLSCAYGKNGTTNNGLIEENYFLFGVNLTLYDFWFIKRKFN